MPLEFCVGLSTFGFQFLASSARALLFLCGSSGFRAARLYRTRSRNTTMSRALSNGEGNVHLPDSFLARARGGNESGIAAGGTAAAT